MGEIVTFRGWQTETLSRHGQPVTISIVPSSGGKEPSFDVTTGGYPTRDGLLALRDLIDAVLRDTEPPAERVA